MSREHEVSTAVVQCNGQNRYCSSECHSYYGLWSIRSVQPVITGIDSEWRKFINSDPVNELESLIEAGLVASPIVHTPLIIRVTRCKMPVIMQLLHTRNSLSGSPTLLRVPSLRPMVQAAISCCCTSDPDPDDAKKLKQPKELVGFELSNKTFEAMTLCHTTWHKIDPHELLTV